MSLLSPLLRLPQRGLAAAAVAARHRLAQARPRPGRNGGQSRRTPRQAAVGGAVSVGSGLGLSAFFLFSGEPAKKAGEGDAEGGEAKADPEDAIILVLKKAKKLTNGERCFLSSFICFMLGGRGHQDDNAILQMSLKLASIYAAQNQDKLALAGYQFCILTLEEKVAKQKETPADALPEEERSNTHLLLAMTLDSYARYLLAHQQTALAQTNYERALQIAVEVSGEKHPQTVVVMNDLATALDAQGLYEEAYAQVSRAAELAQQTQHPDAHVILNNLAGILIHKGDYSQAQLVYQTALEVAEKSGDGVAVRYITKELAQLAKRSRPETSNVQISQKKKKGPP
ncbi:tetratricopeptide repeat protein 19, mitochondrial [Protobothrops mucrosquamatus]|uniref:tetratricopeptide repeat protein 19, mitochondrial n=1 Tax=Protobothrops mucrosquamatus TaxID=103944 RepID=UPI000775C6C4|nr:tetratricopeptide repeat protein 19, mitochondrial [Protobothrops mucrosquamatus]